ncbi:hypothetical protein [Dyella nitratireducens]|uniref:Uncharacterized protein n=1 Tax=Dyella nitratireducens TaxID=1849580 RepID=A0ABQ1GBR8_9GAMM|nr:hypothetical protein [Dyella nitratireducens]GGA40631.1 hypothetical protein GCM10010981_32300 [Dyella nitratireducens]GLQ40588.1 hypothetical protein GCM10007902_04370 [Dyella nitratireducens]
MQLVLNDEDAITIPIDDCIREAWILQYDRAYLSGRIDLFRERLAVCFANSLAQCLDSDLQPPTSSQMAYATAVARELGIALPAEALRFRGAMADFIERFSNVLSQKRQAYLDEN